LIRARTSSLRLLSCVDEASMARGRRAWASAQAAWNSSIDKPKRPGSPPTSFNETRRLKQ
jgi:hypothetical protein